jgi:hypothetical protein
MLFYLAQGRGKKQIPIPVFDQMNWDDPNMLDHWLEMHHYQETSKLPL